MKKELINAILYYLSQQPYAHVAGLIAEIHKDLQENKEDKLTIADD